MPELKNSQVIITHSFCAHKMEFAHPMNKEEVWDFVEDKHFFGYHPAGYGGWVEKVSEKIWVYRHFNSCD